MSGLREISARAVGWAAWIASVALPALLLFKYLHWAEHSLSSLCFDILYWGPFLAGLALHVRRDPRGAVLLGGVVVGEVVLRQWPFGIHHSVAPFLLTLAFASLGNRLHGLDRLSHRERITLLSLGALSAMVGSGLYEDAAELAWGPNRVAPGIGRAATTDWAATVIRSASLEALCLVAIAFSIRGRTAGLLATTALGATWVAHGAAPSVREWCGCLGCPEHPLVGEGSTFAALFAVLALLPWVPAIWRHIAGERPSRRSA